METYNKPALTIEQQLDLLEGRGLLIKDRARAARHLSNVSYYRMSAYMLPFKELDSDGNPIDQFEKGRTWDDIYDLYKFDRKLRLLVFDAIERIEIALRTQVIYQLSHKYGSHWQDNPNIFKKPFKTARGHKIDVYNEIRAHINEQLKINTKAVFIKHYLNKYDNPPTPPSWMSVELLYFNELSKICKHLKDRKDRVEIAKAFGIKDDDIFCSWLHALNYVRNICAHHARLWNIDMDITPGKYNNKDISKVWLTNEEMQTVQTTKLYYTLCLILYLLQTVNPGTKFIEHFEDLLKQYPKVNVGYMGFPDGWREHPLWKRKKICWLRKIFLHLHNQNKNSIE